MARSLVGARKKDFKNLFANELLITTVEAL
jgi:hypothetical protein